MNAQEPWIVKVLEQALGPFEPWLSCDECFDRADVVVEDLLDRNLPLPSDFRAHLAGCPACRDEMESLAEIASSDRGSDPADGWKQLHAQLQQP